MSFTSVENLKIFYHKMFVGGECAIGKNKRVDLNISDHNFLHKNNTTFTSASFSGLERLIAAPYLITYLGAYHWYNEFDDDYHEFDDDINYMNNIENYVKEHQNRSHRSAVAVVLALSLLPPILPIATLLAMAIALLATVVLGLASPFLFAGAAIKDCIKDCMSTGCAPK